MHHYVPNPGDKFTVEGRPDNHVYTCQCTKNGIFSSYVQDGDVGLICFDPGANFSKHYELSSPRIVCADIRSKNGQIIRDHDITVELFSEHLY